MRNAFTFMISVAFIAGLFKFVDPTLADFSWNFALATGGVSLVLTSGLNRLLTPAIQRNAVRDDDSATIGNPSLAARLSKLDAIHRLKLNPRWRFMRKWGLVRKSWGLLAGCLCLPVSGLASDGIFDRLPYMRPLDLLVIIGGSLFVYLELRRIDRLEDQLHCLRDQYIRHLELDRKGISETHGAAGMEKYVCNCGNEESIWSKCKRWFDRVRDKWNPRKVEKSLVALLAIGLPSQLNAATESTPSLPSFDSFSFILGILAAYLALHFLPNWMYKYFYDRSEGDTKFEKLLHGINRWFLRLKDKWDPRKVKSLIVLFGLLSTGIVETAYGQTVDTSVDPIVAMVQNGASEYLDSVKKDGRDSYPYDHDNCVDMVESVYAYYLKLEFGGLEINKQLKHCRESKESLATFIEQLELLQVIPYASTLFLYKSVFDRPQSWTLECPDCNEFGNLREPTIKEYWPQLTKLGEAYRRQNETEIVFLRNLFPPQPIEDIVEIEPT